MVPELVAGPLGFFLFIYFGLSGVVGLDVVSGVGLFYLLCGHVLYCDAGYVGMFAVSLSLLGLVRYVPATVCLGLGVLLSLRLYLVCGVPFYIFVAGDVAVGFRVLYQYYLDYKGR